MDQTIINWALGLLGAALGFILRTVWTAVKDLQESDRELVQKINAVEVLVAGDYVKREDFDKKVDAVFAKLDRIEAKIDSKADK